MCASRCASSVPLSSVSGDFFDVVSRSSVEKDAGAFSLGSRPATAAAPTPAHGAHRADSHASTMTTTRRCSAALSKKRAKHSGKSAASRRGGARRRRRAAAAPHAFSRKCACPAGTRRPRTSARARRGSPFATSGGFLRSRSSSCLRAFPSRAPKEDARRRRGGRARVRSRVVVETVVDARRSRALRVAASPPAPRARWSCPSPRGR